MNLPVVLSVVATALHLVGFWLYFRQMRREASEPNPVSWAIWAALATLNMVSYGVVAADPVKSVATLALTGGCIAVFVYAALRGRRKALTATDYFAAALGFAAIPAWVYFREAAAANLIVQAAAIVGFVPTWRDFLAGRRREHPGSWMMWSVGYSLMITVVFLRWQGNWADVLYPIVGFTEHFITLALVLAARRGAR